MRKTTTVAAAPPRRRSMATAVALVAALLTAVAAPSYAEPLPVPAPTNLQATYGGLVSVTLSWDATVHPNDGVTTDGYELTYKDLDDVTVITTVPGTPVAIQAFTYTSSMVFLRAHFSDGTFSDSTGIDVFRATVQNLGCEIIRSEAETNAELASTAVTLSSLNAFDAAINDADYMVESGSAGPTEVLAAYQAILSSVDGLVRYQSLIDRIATVEAIDISGRTPASRARMGEALDSARLMAAAAGTDPTATLTPEQIETAVNDLAAAYAEEQPAPETPAAPLLLGSLRDAIGTSNPAALTRTDYTAQSWASLLAAHSAAGQLLGAADNADPLATVTQAQVNASAAQLLAARGDLISIVALRASVARNDPAAFTKSGYTAVSWTRLGTTHSAAAALLSRATTSATISAQEVAQRVTELDSARSGLTKVSPGLNVSVIDGTIVVRNSDASGQSFQAGQFGYVPSPNAPPWVTVPVPGTVSAPVYGLVPRATPRTVPDPNAVRSGSRFASTPAIPTTLELHPHPGIALQPFYAWPVGGTRGIQAGASAVAAAGSDEYRWVMLGSGTVPADGVIDITFDLPADALTGDFFFQYTRADGTPVESLLQVVIDPAALAAEEAAASAAATAAATAAAAAVVASDVAVASADGTPEQLVSQALPWVLGGALILLVAAGLIVVCRARRGRYI